MSHFLRGLPTLLPLRPALNIPMDPKLHLAGLCGHCAPRREGGSLPLQEQGGPSEALISRGGKGNRGVIQSLEMKLFLELGRNKTVVDEQGFVNEARSLHMKRMDCEEFQNLKRQEKKCLKGQNRGCGQFQRGLFFYN